MKDRVFKLVGKIMRVPVEKITENSSPGNLDRWDSLHHIDLVMELEQEFNIQFTENQIIDILKDVGTILKIINELKKE